MRKYISIFIIILMTLTVISCSNNSKKSIQDSNSVNTNDTNIQEEGSATAADSEEVVMIKDSELEKIVREKIGKAEGDLTTLDMSELYSMNINCEETPVYELDGLEYAINLNDFSFRYGNGKTLTPVSKLPNLEYMNISYSTFEEPSENFETPMLERISFIETNVSDLNFLSNVTSARSTYFSNSGINSIEFLKKWDNLEEISLDYNSISDLSPLKDKTKITILGLHQNEVVSIEALETLVNLESLNLSYNHVNNIGPIMDLQHLSELTIYEELDAKIIDRNLIDILIGKGVNVMYHK